MNPPTTTTTTPTPFSPYINADCSFLCGFLIGLPPSWPLDLLLWSHCKNTKPGCKVPPAKCLTAIRTVLSMAKNTGSCTVNKLNVVLLQLKAMFGLSTHLDLHLFAAAFNKYWSVFQTHFPKDLCTCILILSWHWVAMLFGECLPCRP